MATLTSRQFVQEIIDKDGYGDPGDPRVIMIVEYNNDFNGAVAWGVIFQGEDAMRYHNSAHCHNVKTIWVAGGKLTK